MRNNDIDTVADLIDYSVEELLELENVGHVWVKKLKDFLASNGLSLKNEEAPDLLSRIVLLEKRLQKLESDIKNEIMSPEHGDDKYRIFYQKIQMLVSEYE